MAKQTPQRRGSRTAGDQADEGARRDILARAGEYLLDIAERIITRTSSVGDRAIYASEQSGDPETSSG